MSEGNSGQGTTPVNRWRSVVETVVQANRQLVEDAQLEDIEDPVQRHAHSRGERTTLDVWKEIISFSVRQYRILRFKRQCPMKTLKNRRALCLCDLRREKYQRRHCHQRQEK
jgi:hypothetical protein